MMSHKLYNLKKLEEIARGDQEFIRDMVFTFVENVSSDLNKILSFKSVNNWKSIAETAHKLASNFAYLGVDALHSLAANIEKSVLNDNDLTGIVEKTDRLYQEGILMLDQVKKDFYMTNAN